MNLRRAAELRSGHLQMGDTAHGRNLLHRSTFYRNAAFNLFVVLNNCFFNPSTCLAISSNSFFATNPALAT
jgi:hypothetical protein